MAVAKARAETNRFCWWCGEGSSPENPLTKEHIIARWMAHALEGSGVLNHAWSDPGGGADSRAWKASEPSFTARVVCHRCNSGWMSALEQQAKKYLPPFMKARPGLRVNFVNGPVLARWAAKTALMFQGAEPDGNRVLPPEHYELLRASEVGVLPPIMRVWIGAVRARGVWATSFAGSINLASGPVRNYTVLVAVDQVAFMVIGADRADAIDQLRLGDLENAWTPLWPIECPTDWPPPYVWPADQFAGMAQILEAGVGRRTRTSRPI